MNFAIIWRRLSSSISFISYVGIEYSVGRIPIGSCDFSTHPYSYDDVDGDFNLTKFQLAKEDLTLKVQS